MAELAKFALHPGDIAPDFALPATDGKTYRRDDFSKSKLLLVSFWCNHCPYVQAWESRMIELGNQYLAKGVAFVLINSNDPTSYPEDRFERMVDRARQKKYPFPYLHDASQTVARDYGALVTPHPMLFGSERRLLFQGRIDDNHEHPEQVKKRFLREAIDHALAGRSIAQPELPVLGCSVKWRM